MAFTPEIKVFMNSLINARIRLLSNVVSGMTNYSKLVHGSNSLQEVRTSTGGREAWIKIQGHRT